MTASPSSGIGSWKLVRGKGRPEAYRTADGTRVASVTTITGARQANPEPLRIWSYRCGYEDAEKGLSPDPKRRVQAAADAGSIAHHMAENHIHGRLPMEGLVLESLEPSTLAAAQAGFAGFESWSRLMQVDYLATETPMVSEIHGYGGTPDAVGLVDGKVSLLDWKSSNAVYGDYLVQLAAYRELWNEVHPERPIEQCYLLRFGKGNPKEGIPGGDFHFHSYTPEMMQIGWTAFAHLLALYTLDKQLKKMAS